MLNSLVKLFEAAPAGRIDVLARQVADLSLESVCQLVGEHVTSMTFSEARGYVRARGSRIVRRNARLAISRQPGAELAWEDAIARAATERIVPLVLRQTGVGVPQLAMPIRVAA